MLLSKLLFFRPPKKRSQKIASVLCFYSKASGPVAVKALQFISARHDLVGPDFADALRKLQTECGSISKSKVGDVANELYQKYGIRTVGGPISVGSSAFVLQGFLRNGQTIAIKVCRWRDLNFLVCDLKIVKFLCRVFSVVPSLRHLPIDLVFEEFKHEVMASFDLRREAEILNMVNKCKNSERVIFPVALDISSPSTLIMDFIVHQSFEASSLSQDIKKLRVEDIISEFFYLIFKHGLVHCDLHPGNVGLNERGYAVLLDFGFSSLLEEEERMDFRDFFLALATRNSHSAVRIIKNNAIQYSLSAQDELLFIEQIDDLFSDIRVVSAERFSILDFVDTLFRLQRKFGVIASPKFSRTIWGLTSVEWLAKSYNPDLKFVRLAMPAILNSLANDRRRYPAS